MPGTIVAAYFFTAGTVAYYATAFAVSMIASAIIAKAFMPKMPSDSADQTPNPGNNQQVGPAGDNKLPVIFGTAYTGGIITDLSISSDNQKILYVLSLCEVTSIKESGGTPNSSAITFGDVYWGGKKCVFKYTQYPPQVSGLLDESTGVLDESVDGHLFIYLYKNGSNVSANGIHNAITVMSQDGLVYKWDNTKLMTNTAFAIVQINYSQKANLTGIQQTRFQITNSRKKPGDCFLDYLTNTRYGAAIPIEQINQTSLTELNTYSDAQFSYTNYSGTTSYQKRFEFNGLIHTSNTIMNNLQAMASCCDCLIKYNEIYGTWGVIVQKPSFTVVMDINDSNMVSAIQITPIDLSSSYNIAEVKFPDGSSKDTFNSATFDLAVINPALLYPNEPINKQSINLSLTNNSVTAQYLANRFLESAREDLQVKVDISYKGLQLEAGDIVTVTNSNYGWVAKLFRIGQVVEKFGSDGSITAGLSLMEFNPAVYDDKNITEFTPAPNTGIGSPLGFGSISVPTVSNAQVSSAIPSFDVDIYCSANGIVQYAELYYSAYASPTDAQRIFAGTTPVNPGGNPYEPSSLMSSVTLSNLPQGNWYFASRMVNNLGSSLFSASSAVFQWRPLTFQFKERWVAVAYADDSTGTTGFSYNPRNKTWFGLFNSPSANQSANVQDYTWYAGTFGTNNYLLIANRDNRKFTFAVGNAGYTNLGGAFVPSESSIYDSSLWGALEDGENYIDLDQRTGQLTKAGSTSISSADGLISVTNNTNGSMIVSLEKFLNFGNGVYSKSFNASTLTIDVFGRVVGFTEPDNFYYTDNIFTASSGQTVFNVNHIVGNVLVYRDGVYQNISEFTETTTTVTLNNACATGEIVIIVNMRVVSGSAYYEVLQTTITSSASTSVVFNALPYQSLEAGNQLCFASTQPDGSALLTTFTVSSVNYTTKTIVFTTAISGATVGFDIYRYRAAGAEYRPFSRFTQNVTNTTSISPTNFTLNSGFEMIFLNGVQFNEIDYDLSGNTITGMPGAVTGVLSVIQFAGNNLGVPASNVTNNVAYSVSGVLTYAFPNNPLSLEVYANGLLFAKNGGDYNANANGYNLTTPFNNNITLLNQQTFARIDAA